MTLKRFLMIGFVAAVLVACGNDGSSATDSDEVSSSSVCEDCGVSSSSKAKSSSSSVKSCSSSAKSSSSNENDTNSSSSAVKSSSSETGESSSSVPEGYVDPSTVVKGTMTDERDGQTYKTVTVGTQTWMAENLNYAYTGVPYDKDNYTSDSISWCYNNDASNCSKYGRLYTWAAAMDSAGTWTTNGKGCGFRNECSPTYPVRGICPEGWHLPSETEWDSLRTAVGGGAIAGKMLKSTSGWDDINGEHINCTDAYAFSVLPAGFRVYEGSFKDEGLHAHFWSSTEYELEGAYYAYYTLWYSYLDKASLYNSYKYSGLSVRCVKD